MVQICPLNKFLLLFLQKKILFVIAIIDYTLFTNFNSTLNTSFLRNFNLTAQLFEVSVKSFCWSLLRIFEYKVHSYELTVTGTFLPLFIRVLSSLKMFGVTI